MPLAWAEETEDWIGSFARAGIAPVGDAIKTAVSSAAVTMGKARNLMAQGPSIKKEGMWPIKFTDLSHATSDKVQHAAQTPWP
ncbi:MAG: hypothetical protein SPD98_07775 [Tractidigestivibacter sp.]|uniref:hypothetical protein n=1 Tax=Tractidigestivibacter sp. TaxID=2847320 RepID=UPI002A823598|nr:hypothetical protein [Tractidigestivibacter sp.]MDY4535129.1 hypothetical protein [Tractidigestivibacter sp.]